VYALDVAVAYTNSSAMHIGQFSQKLGVSIDTIRFYERSRLLREPARTSGGFRLYSRSDLSALRFIRILRKLGFSLNEIREFLSLRANGLAACSAVRNMLDEKLKDVRARKIVLSKTESEIKRALKDCDRQFKSRREKRKTPCPVLTALRGDTPLQED
jgi:DNA-binding transcriptional MerR regulator